VQWVAWGVAVSGVRTVDGYCVGKVDGGWVLRWEG
jgi:hypothetical protein